MSNASEKPGARIDPKRAGIYGGHSSTSN